MSIPWRKVRRFSPSAETAAASAVPCQNNQYHHHHHQYPSKNNTNKSSSRHKLRPVRNLLVSGWKQPRLKLWNIIGLFLIVNCLFCRNIMMSYLYHTTTPYYPEENEELLALENLPLRFQNVSEGAPHCKAIKPENVSYTLVTQTSENRLWMMEEHCRRWGHFNPISIAVYSTKPKDTVLSIRKKLRKMGCRPSSLNVQLISDANSTKEDYPINTLRNMALRAVQTTHIAYIDMDFWESIDLYDNLMLPHVREHLAADPKAAVVIPAFMFKMQCKKRIYCRPLVPRNRTELLHIFEKPGNGTPKVTRFSRSNEGAHGTTRYDDWINQSTHNLLPIPCTKSNRYEPYLVVRWCNKLPPFQDIFTGYGKNKISWIMHLRRAGWTMHQLGESFVVHYPHLPSEARVAWDGGPSKVKQQERSSEELMRFLTDNIFIKFKHWLMTHVPDEMRLEACEEAENDDSLLWAVNKNHD